MKKSIKKLLRYLFETGQLLGFDLLPRHFYSEIPDIRSLKKNKKWLSPYTMVGVAGADIAEQFGFVKDCCAEFFEVLKEKRAHASALALTGHDGYGIAESDFLQAFILKKKPRKVIQIGCGLSTAIMLDAGKKNGAGLSLTCIDPFPDDYLKDLEKDGRITLVSGKAEEVPINLYLDLQAGDLLFVDSTHTLRPGGEVPRIILEILPRLPRGVFIHFHDIYFPYDYSRGVLEDDLFFQHESILLHAFLANNSQYSVAACLSMLHYANPETLKTFLPNYMPAKDNFGLRISDGHFPSALYLYKQQ